WLAHTYLEGLPWPDGAAPADDGLTPLDRFVVWVETEDGQAAMSDRMDRWNMRRSQVLLPGSDGLGRLDLGRAPDVEQIATVAQRAGAGLVVVDTLAGGHATDENSAALRELLKPLSGIAQSLNVPILVCHHLRKKGLLERDEVTMDRLRGTSVISAHARSIIALDKPAGDEAPRRLAVIKGNLTAERPRLGMELTATAPRFVAAPEPRQAPGSVAVSAVQQAMDFLQGLPPEGRLFSELRAEAETCGISKNALYQAAEELGLVRSKQGRASTWKPAPVGQEGTES
ncbi:MAG: AAA family ATPase, partial [Armatimonadetes bacterium]|nr:AAA family ATPase [Armatimonadota bacterium]